MSDTLLTRHLCAAVYVDAALRVQLLEDVFHHPYRAFAPSPGIDSGLVMRHCLAAERRQRNVDWMLLAVFAAYVCSAALAPLFLPVTFWLSAGAAFLVAFVSEYSLRWGALAARLKDPRNDPAIKRYPANAAQRDTLESLARWETSELAIYSGFSPFVGCGTALERWSLVVNVTRPAPSLGSPAGRALPVDSNELYDFVTHAVQRLGISGLNVGNRICINGKDIRNDRRFLPNPHQRPNATADVRTIAELADPTSPKARMYRSYRITRWGGDLALSQFLRFARSGEYLFVESSTFLNTPIREHYRFLETPHTFRQLLRIVGVATAVATFSFFFVPLRMLGRIGRSYALWSQARRLRHAVDDTLTFDYGATATMRERASQTTYTRYFQMIDEDMCKKMLDKRMLESLIDFLDSKNVDTTDIRDRGAVILNNGVIISGSGTLQAQTMAVGQAASAVGALRRLGSQVFGSGAAPAKKGVATHGNQGVTS
jgi:hypothetical protein